jgi:hypothetical protein
MFRRWFFAHSHIAQKTGQSAAASARLLHCRITSGAALLFAAATPCWPSSAIRGSEYTIVSPGGATERCVALDHVPGNVYSAAGHERETGFCSIDFNGAQHALLESLQHQPWHARLR